MKLKNKFFSNIVWLFFDKVLRIFGGLFVGVWVARYLGPEDYGILNYAIAYTALFTIFVRLGLDQIVVRELVKLPEMTNELLGTAFLIKLAGALISISIIALSLYFLQTDFITKIIIFVIALNFILQSIDVIDMFYESKVLSKYVVIARNSAFIFSTLLKIYLIIYKFSVVYFAIAGFVDGVVGSIFLLVLYKKTGNKVTQWRYNKQTVKKYLKYCWPLAISTFLITIHLRVDQVMIGNMLNNEQVGIYSVAVSLAESWYFIPTIIVSTLMPYFVELRENNARLYHFRLKQLYFFMFWMGVGVGFFVLFFGKPLLLLLFGKEYISSYNALVINIWTGIFVAQSSAKGIWVISENLQLYRIIANIFAVIINISVNLILIPKYGITGAAVATLITRFINNWITPVLIVKPYRINTIISIKSINPFYVYRGRICEKH